MITKGLEHNKNKLLENSLCFIKKSIDSLEKGELKYAILHLFSGVYLILKVRLYEKDWRLLFNKRDDANYGDFESGSFYGVNFCDCITRLSKIASLRFTDQDKQELELLRRKKNKIEHFFDNDSQSEDSVKSSLYHGINFFINFVQKNNIGKINEESEENIRNIMDDIKNNLFSLEAFCQKRMNSLKEDISKSKMILTCNECYQKAMVLKDSILQCMFCHKEIQPEHSEELDGLKEVEETHGIHSYKDANHTSIYCVSCDIEVEMGVVQINDGSHCCLLCEEIFVPGSLLECGSCTSLYLQHPSFHYDEHEGPYSGCCPICNRYNA